MTHIPAPVNRENALCPSCNIEFGYVVNEDNNTVACPGCGTEQELPVIMTGKMEYRCLDCGTDFTAPDSNPCCPGCGEAWKDPRTG